MCWTPLYVNRHRSRE